jgi:hypothetical protein
MGDGVPEETQETPGVVLLKFPRKKACNYSNLVKKLQELE